MSEKDQHTDRDEPDPPCDCGTCPPFTLNLCHALNRVTLDCATANFTTEDHIAPARRTIWRERERLERVPVICQGWATTAITLSDGRRQILSFLLPGDLISASSIYEPISRYSVEAITDVRYRSFARSVVRAALERSADLLATVSELCSSEAAQSSRLAVDLGRRGAPERIASLILGLADRLRERGMMRGQTMDFPLRQHHIADAASLTVVHVGNTLAEFRRNGLLEINDRSLTISNPQGLREVAMH